MPFPAWDLLAARALRAAAREQALRHRRDQPRLPVLVRLLRRADPPGPQVPRARAPKALVDEIERATASSACDFFYLWGDTVTLNVKSFTRVLRRADRAQPRRSSGSATPAPTTSPIRRSCTACASPAAGCSRSASSRESEDVRKDMVKRLERQKIQAALHEHARRRASSRSRSSSSAIRARRRRRSSRRRDYAIELDPDFANFYPAVPYPGTALYEKCVRDGLLAERGLVADGVLGTTCCAATASTSDVVMEAINRAKRRFFLRPRYVAAPRRRHRAPRHHQVARRRRDRAAPALRLDAGAAAAPRAARAAPPRPPTSRASAARACPGSRAGSSGCSSPRASRCACRRCSSRPAPTRASTATSASASCTARCRTATPGIRSRPASTPPTRCSGRSGPTSGSCPPPIWSSRSPPRCCCSRSDGASGRRAPVRWPRCCSSSSAIRRWGRLGGVRARGQCEVFIGLVVDGGPAAAASRRSTAGRQARPGARASPRARCSAPRSSTSTTPAPCSIAAARWRRWLVAARATRGPLAARVRALLPVGVAVGVRLRRPSSARCSRSSPRPARSTTSITRRSATTSSTRARPTPAGSRCSATCCASRSSARGSTACGSSAASAAR